VLLCKTLLVLLCAVDSHSVVDSFGRQYVRRDRKTHNQS
jgi:hypothetical protein